MPGGQNIYDWATLRCLYVEGPDTVTRKSLADEHGVPFTSMEKRSSHENWSRLRAEFRQDVTDRVRCESVKRHADMRLKLLDHQVALIGAALKHLYDPQTHAIKGDVSLQDLDRLINTYDRMMARETGEDTPQIGARINIHLAQAVDAAGVPGSQTEGLLARVVRMRPSDRDSA